MKYEIWNLMYEVVCLAEGLIVLGGGDVIQIDSPTGGSLKKDLE
ncbi:hypothetical protein [Enterovibrio gelatinilyticus]|nr:hypothetical protein [Enterovibrio sp. ZSDZ42]